MANKDIHTFLNEYTAFRATTNGQFQSNPTDDFIELKGLTDLNQTVPKWSVIIKSKFSKKRYPFIKDVGKFLWLNIGGGSEYQKDASSSSKSFGIMIRWDLKRVIKDMQFDNATGYLTLTVNKDANFWYFDSSSKVSSVDFLRNFTGKLEAPNTTPNRNMDSQSPIHPPTGMQEMSGPFI